MSFLEPQQRLISEKHVGLFSAESASSSGLETFTNQATFAGAILFDRPTHAGDALGVLRSLRLHEPHSCNSFHSREHSGAVPRAIEVRLYDLELELRLF